METAIEVSPDRPVLVDRFLEDAIEVDVDCICDGETAVVGAIMEHIEQAGIHSGDSACVIPTFSLSAEGAATRSAPRPKAMARELDVRGLMNVQFAVKDECVYVLEVNPRASRTIPFVSKAIGVPLAKMAAQVMTGASLRDLGFTRDHPGALLGERGGLPVSALPGSGYRARAEMKSTGEVMGIDVDLGLAFAKSQMAAQPSLPAAGNVFISVKDADKQRVIPIAREFIGLNFGIISTGGTAAALSAAGIPVTKVYKLREGRPNVLDRVKNGDINFIINTPAERSRARMR
jgi:carbamoyl-phosphate synthase large subunit